MTIEEIKADLNEIRFYYSKQREFDSALKTIGKCETAIKAEKYNAAICKASATLYSLYIALYVNNNTQLVVALDWNRSVNYVKQHNKDLYNFFLEQFENDG